MCHGSGGRSESDENCCTKHKCYCRLDYILPDGPGILTEGQKPNFCPPKSRDVGFFVRGKSYGLAGQELEGQLQEL